LVDVGEFSRLVDEIGRDRKTLEQSHGDLLQELDELGAMGAARREAGSPPVPREIMNLVLRLTNYMEIEREQNARLFQLLVETAARLVEAEGGTLPADWRRTAGLD
jgi:hypothetical protein